jgi:hypothetical protein
MVDSKCSGPSKALQLKPAKAAHSHDEGCVRIDLVPDHCSICLDDFVPGDEHRGLPCPHGAHFHKDCIDPWLTRYMTCPLCKSNFLRAAVVCCAMLPMHSVHTRAIIRRIRHLHSD